MRRETKKLTLLLSAIYAVSYIVRLDLGAVVVEITASTGMQKSDVSLALTGLFITYGIGQLISGFVGDYIQPRRMIAGGIFVSALMNILVPFLVKNPVLLAVVWSVNGLAQAMIWPPMVRIMTALLDDAEYGKSIVWLAFGCAAGTILVYLISPLIITLLNWEWVFFIGAGICLIFIPFIIKFCPRLDRKTVPAVPKNNNKKQGAAGILFSPVMLVIMAAIIVHGALRDGVTTWMPSYINETYNFGGSISILTSVILPVFAILINTAASRIYLKVSKNPIIGGAIIFAAGGFSSVVLTLFNDKSAVTSIAALAILSGAMHGVNYMLVCVVPSFFRESGRVSFISGVINACTYVGSALSIYCVSMLTEARGWGATAVLWCVIAWVGTALCLAAIPLWRRKQKEKDKA